MKDHPSKEEYRIAAFAGGCWLAVVVLSLLFSSVAHGERAVTASELRSTVCRITNQMSGVANVGSGTLVDKTEDGDEGLVLTCAHLFSEGVGEILVEFADGKTHRAKLIDSSRQADLAALAIVRPLNNPAEIVFDFKGQERLHACGYGPRGVYRCAVGPVVGQAAGAGQMSLLIGDGVRSGDSGGGVFDEQGRLVAVIWGEASGVTYASYGRPLRRFLGRTLNRFRGVGQQAVVVRRGCAGGTCPIRPWPGGVGRSLPEGRSSLPTALTPGNGQHPIVVDSRWAEYQKQLDQLRAEKQDRGDYVTRDQVQGLMPDLGGYARREAVDRIEHESTSRHAGLLSRIETLSGRSVGKAAGAAAAGLFGLSGPMGWAVVAVGSVGGWLVGRRIKKRVRGAGGRRRRRRFQR